VGRRKKVILIIMAIEFPSNIASNSTPSVLKHVLGSFQFCSSWLLLLLFVVAFVTNGVLTAEPSADSKEPLLTGPGGKPLPRSAKKKKAEEELIKRQLQDFSYARKLVFYYLSAGVIGTFIASGTNVIIHALTEREKGWWCGENAVVSGNLYSKYIMSSCLTSKH
jgi:hypothetical protein